ncbi:MAG: TrkH family potassium uptake protein [bacterium]
MKFSPTLQSIGALQLLLAAVLLIPLLISLIYGESDTPAILAAIGIAVLIGGPLWWFNRQSRNLQFRDTVLIVTLGWFSICLVGCLPFVLHGSIPSLTDAFFEVMSGLTTSGSTILDDIEALPHGLLFWRSMTHFLGGMGMIGLYLLIFSYVGSGNLQMYRIESAPGQGGTGDKMLPNVRLTMKWLWGIYLLLNGVCAILLWFGGLSWFDAVCHAFSAVATGGYSTLNASAGGFGSAYVEWILCLFMFLGGMDFVLHYQALKGNWQSLAKSTELKAYLMICFVLGVGVSGLLWLNGTNSNLLDALRYGFFQVLSLLTTTGYSTTDYELWPQAAQMLLFFCLFIGACSGSTTSGIRIVHLVLLIRFLERLLHRMARPHAVQSILIDGKPVEMSVVNGVLDFIVLQMHAVVIGGVFLSILSPEMDWWSGLNMMMASLWNIGPAFGDVGPTENYAHVSDAGTWFLSLMMLAGRLDIITVLILFSPAFWKSHR